MTATLSPLEQARALREQAEAERHDLVREGLARARDAKAAYARAMRAAGDRHLAVAMATDRHDWAVTYAHEAARCYFAARAARAWSSSYARRLLRA